MLKTLFEYICKCFNKKSRSFITEPDHHEVSCICIAGKEYFCYAYYELDNKRKVYYYNLEDIRTTYDPKGYVDKENLSFIRDKEYISEQEIENIKNFAMNYNKAKGFGTVFYYD
ncbi:MAG: hypothetical protein SFY68_02820 [Candidatus Sumerlaeia bacterium]|nr:hypothetical protein [Candidatus Sumerlaeia bacterium]